MDGEKENGEEKQVYLCCFWVCCENFLKLGSSHFTIDSPKPETLPSGLSVLEIDGGNVYIKQLARFKKYSFLESKSMNCIYI